MECLNFILSSLMSSVTIIRVIDVDSYRSMNKLCLQKMTNLVKECCFFLMPLISKKFIKPSHHNTKSWKIFLRDFYVSFNLNLSPSCPEDRNSSVFEQCAWRWRHISTKQTALPALQSAFSCLIYLKRLHSLKCMFIKWLLVLNWQPHITYRYYSPIILCLWSSTSLSTSNLFTYTKKERRATFLYSSNINRPFLWWNTGLKFQAPTLSIKDARTGIPTEGTNNIR